MAPEPAKRATELKNCRPLHGLEYFIASHPGAYAPGFMLTPASQASLLAVVSSLSLSDILARRIDRLDCGNLTILLYKLNHHIRKLLDAKL